MVKNTWFRIGVEEVELNVTATFPNGAYAVIEGTTERLCRILGSLGGLGRQILESKSCQEVYLVNPKIFGL